MVKICTVVPQNVKKVFWNYLHFKQIVVSCSVEFSKVSLDKIVLYQEEH